MVYVPTLLLWAAGCVLYCRWYIVSILTPPFRDDAYANSEGFQFLMFMIFRFPLLLVGLFGILYLEAIICNLFFTRKDD